MSERVPLLSANAFGQGAVKLEEKAKSFATDFKKFIIKGNVFDLAVAVILGAAFQAVVNSFATDIVQPPIGLLVGSSLVNAFVVLRKPTNQSINVDDLHTPAAVAAAGGVTWNYGNFLQQCLNLLIIGIILFLLVKLYLAVSRAFKKQNAKPPVAALPCPQCLEPVAVVAKRCKTCTSWLDAEAPMPAEFVALRAAELKRLAEPVDQVQIQVAPNNGNDDGDDNDDESSLTRDESGKKILKKKSSK